MAKAKGSYLTGWEVGGGCSGVCARVCARSLLAPRVPAPGSLKASTAILLPFVHFTIRSQGLPQYRCRQPLPPVRSVPPGPPQRCHFISMYVCVNMHHRFRSYPFLCSPFLHRPQPGPPFRLVSCMGCVCVSVSANNRAGAPDVTKPCLVCVCVLSPVDSRFVANEQFVAC